MKAGYTIQDLHNDAKAIYEQRNNSDRPPKDMSSFIEGFCEGSFHGYGMIDISDIARTALTMQTNPPSVDLIHQIAKQVEEYYSKLK